MWGCLSHAGTTRPDALRRRGASVRQAKKLLRSAGDLAISRRQARQWAGSCPWPAGRSAGQRRLNPHTLYVLDEPTVGLPHGGRGEAGSMQYCTGWSMPATRASGDRSQLDLIAEADWIIDMVRAAPATAPWLSPATPTVLKAKAKSHTGAVLSGFAGVTQWRRKPRLE